MKQILRPIAAVVMCLLLALTSQSMAASRGMAAATGQMVICTGTGPVTVYVDASGEPTTAPHQCPDCVLNFAACDAQPDLRVFQPVVAVRFASQEGLSDELRNPSLGFLARAPPGLALS